MAIISVIKPEMRLAIQGVESERALAHRTDTSTTEHGLSTRSGVISSLGWSCFDAACVTGATKLRGCRFRDGRTAFDMASLGDEPQTGETPNLSEQDHAVTGPCFGETGSKARAP